MQHLLLLIKIFWTVGLGRIPDAFDSTVGTRARAKEEYEWPNWLWSTKFTTKAILWSEPAKLQTSSCQSVWFHWGVGVQKRVAANFENVIEMLHLVLERASINEGVGLEHKRLSCNQVQAFIESGQNVRLGNSNFNVTAMNLMLQIFCQYLHRRYSLNLSCKMSGKGGANVTVHLSINFFPAMARG